MTDAPRNLTLRRHASFDTIENDIAELHRQPVRISPLVLSAVEDVGRLSAEAVQAQFENAAKNVEEMGTEVKERIRRLEDALQECDADLRLIGEAARKIREKGQTVYTEIEETSALSKNIRDTCSDFMKRVANKEDI